jgi:hypothetical protein
MCEHKQVRKEMYKEPALIATQCRECGKRIELKVVEESQLKQERKEIEKVSNCCSAKVVNGFCMDCKEHCVEVDAYDKEKGIDYTKDNVFDAIGRPDLIPTPTQPEKRGEKLSSCCNASLYERENGLFYCSKCEPIQPEKWKEEFYNTFGVGILDTKGNYITAKIVTHIQSLLSQKDKEVEELPKSIMIKKVEYWLNMARMSHGWIIGYKSAKNGKVVFEEAGSTLKEAMIRLTRNLSYNKSLLKPTK